MKNFLERYKVKIKTRGPVFIGSGEFIKSKEWLLDLKNNVAIIPDYRKLLLYLEEKGLASEFESFFVRENKPLGSWLREHDIFFKEYIKFEKYRLDCSGVQDIKDPKGNFALFIKDPYGKPYVPGSSIKGAIRNVILAAELAKRKNSQYQEDILRDIDNYRGRNSYLRGKARRIETGVFNTIGCFEKDQGNMVNSVMKGIRVSDSRPLDYGDLTLCQKFDYSVSKKENPLPIVRECLKPSTEIEAELVIDKTVCKYSIFDIEQAVELFLKDYNEMFLKFFDEETQFDGKVIYLGGGVGYASKTVTNQIFKGNPNRVEYVSKIIDKTVQKPCHTGNKRSGVSPHIVKLTEFDRKLYQMGPCDIEFIKESSL